MRRAYIISYDLNKAGQNYEDVLKKIKGHGTWARLGGSAYIIISTKSAVDIRDSIRTAMDSNDQLFVGAINAPAAWIGLSEEVSDWLKNNLE